MKKHIIIIFIIFFGEFYTHAQLNIGGEPLSFSKESINKNITGINLPIQNNALLIADAEKNDTKGQAWQFGKNIDVNINVKKEAVIDTLPEGKLYRINIKSKNATTINLRFSNYKLPNNAVLYIYNYKKTDIIGGFTSRNNNLNEIFATGLLKGDNIILEYFEPKDAKFPGKLIIDRVTHGFRSIFDFSKSFGQSGNCNMNVACPDADDWQNEVRSACILVTGSSGFCSGTLINNTNEDGKPYILTANHCYKEPTDMVFMFNWESETCDNPTLSPAHDDLSGAVLIAKNSVSDFCLFEMNDTPPYNYEVFYSGWNVDDNPSNSSVCIHHPSGDIKKISFDDNPSISDFYEGYSGEENSHWKVIWDRETTTEPGSSGSPLYNENHEIIGQLHGGYASCSNQDEPDWYGKLSFSWDFGDTPETRLKEHLDPNNTTYENFPGYDPNIPLFDNDVQVLRITAPEENYFGIANITPSFKIRNRGNIPLTSFKVTYILDNELPVSKQWTGNLESGEITDINFDELSFDSGKYSLKVFVENPNGTEDDYKYNDTLNRVFFVYEKIFEDDFENDKSWYLTGEFQIDKPVGLGGSLGYPDPTFATSGEYVLGTDLTGLGQHKGDYENNVDEDFAQSPVIDCRNFNNTLLTFNRWLGTDKSGLDRASIEIFSDSSWTTIFDKANTRITDFEWRNQLFDISEIADGKKIIIKFITGPTDHADQFCGWNIDDFIVSGIRSEEPIFEEEQINLFPNPARDYFYIEINDELAENAIVNISDLSGKILFNKEFKSNEIKTIETTAYKKSFIKIELTDKISEMLIVKVTTEKQVFSGKVVLLQKGK